jgi:predicted PurR-regulated permease PerM
VDTKRSAELGLERREPRAVPAGAGGSRRSDLRTFALLGLFAIALLYTAYFARVFLLPVVLALLLTALLRPLVRVLHRAGLPEPAGAGLAVVALVALLVAGGQALIAPASNWIERVPATLNSLEARVRALRRPVDQVNVAAERVKEMTQSNEGTKEAPVAVEIRAPSMSGILLGKAIAIATGAVTTVILLFFLLASGDLFLRRLVHVLPRRADKERAVEGARRIGSDISRWLLTVTAINTGLGVVEGLAMALVGMPNPLLWGVMAGVLNFVPYVGAIVGTAVIAVVSMVTFEESLGQALLPPILYFTITGIEGQLVTPMLLGRRLALNPVILFTGLIFWGWLWGVPGALLAVPMLVVAKIICDQVPALKPAGEFLGR